MKMSKRIENSDYYYYYAPCAIELKEPALENAEKKNVLQNHNAQDKRMKEERLYEQI